jgi:hypothetical protein
MILEVDFNDISPPWIMMGLVFAIYVKKGKKREPVKAL